MRRLWAAWLALMLAVGVAAGVDAGAPARAVTVEQARHLLETQGGGLVVLDVRTPEEFGASHLQGATNLNVMAPDFESRVGKLDRGKDYLVYCRTGNRSERAVQVMTRLGFTKVHHMVDGIVGWQAKQLPLTR